MCFKRTVSSYMLVRLWFLSNLFITTTNIYIILLIKFVSFIYFILKFLTFIVDFCLTTGTNYNHLQVLASQIISLIDVDVLSSVTCNVRYLEQQFFKLSRIVEGLPVFYHCPSHNIQVIFYPPPSPFSYLWVISQIFFLF